VFESLQGRLQQIVQRLAGRGVLSEADVDTALREVRLALLEADVNFKVAKAFVERVRAAAVGQQVLTHLAPGQQVVKLVYEELVRLLGGTTHALRFADQPPTVILLVGLHGAGKTTTAGKLAMRLRSDGPPPLRSSRLSDGRPACSSSPSQERPIRSPSPRLPSGRRGGQAMTW